MHFVIDVLQNTLKYTYTQRDAIYDKRQCFLTLSQPWNHILKNKRQEGFVSLRKKMTTKILRNP